MAPEAGETLDVAAIRWPLVANAGDLDPLRLEPQVRVRWVRSAAELGQPDLVVLPGSKATRSDLDWFRTTGLAAAVAATEAPVVAICAGLQMCGTSIEDPDGVEGPPGSSPGLGWLPIITRFEGDKVLDRPAGTVVDGPGQGERVAGYRIHHGRVQPVSLDAGATSSPIAWLVTDDGAPLGWYEPAPEDRPRPERPQRAGDAVTRSSGARTVVLGTTLHALFEDDGFRAGFLAWVAQRAGKRWVASGMGFEAARQARLDRIADALAAHLDLDRLADIIASGSVRRGTESATGTESSAGTDQTEAIVT